MVDCCGMRCVERRASVLWTQKALDTGTYVGSFGSANTQICAHVNCVHTFCDLCFWERSNK